MRSLLLAAVLVSSAAAACTAGHRGAPSPVEVSASRVGVGQAPGSVQFGLVVDPQSRRGAPTTDYPHWDAGGTWAVPAEAIWTLEEPLLTCRVAKVRRSIDALGFPAVDVALEPEDGERFKAFTRGAVGRRLAVLVDGRVVLTPTVAEPLPPRFQLAGRLSEDDVGRLLEHLQPPAR